jgi:hypothetical protein
VFFRPTVETIQLGVLVDGAGKIQFCYLNESVAIKTCQMAGGTFDPFPPIGRPKCRFNYAGISCSDPASCVTDVTPAGQIVCSDVPAGPSDPGPATWCVCGCVNQMGLPPGAACGSYNVGAGDPAGACLGGPGICTNYSYASDQGWAIGNPMPGAPGATIDSITNLTGCITLPAGTLPGGCP